MSDELVAGSENAAEMKSFSQQEKSRLGCFLPFKPWRHFTRSLGERKGH